MTEFNLLEQLATIGMLALVLAVQLLILLAAGPISRLIGAAGACVIGRIMGILLAAFAVGMVLSAVRRIGSTCRSFVGCSECRA